VKRRLFRELRAETGGCSERRIGESEVTLLCCITVSWKEVVWVLRH